MVRQAGEGTSTWHALPPERVIEALGAGPEGLSAAEARSRLGRHGPNRIERARRAGPLRILLRQLASPLVYVLVFAAVAAIALGKTTDGGVIAAVVVINALVGFVQEFRAGRAIEALGRMVPTTATVLRDGSQRQVPTDEVVPGDAVLLQPGDMVPADLRLIEADELRADEAALTGESLAVTKSAAPVPEDAALGDRTSMAFGGTLVVSGTARAVAVATGGSTELGRISSMLGEVRALETPLTRRLARLAVAIALSVAVVAVLIFVVGVLREYSPVDSLLAAITLAVAAIPEGLPAAITIASAIGVRRMARRRAIIRHLPAVETLGSTTVICTDKTGTLTKNEMTVRAVWTPGRRYELTGVGYDPDGGLTEGGVPVAAAPEGVVELLRASVLCNDASLARRDGRWSIVGDPTEAALLVAARKAGLDEDRLRAELPRRDTSPFDSERQFMATLHRADGPWLLCLKGAPEVVVGRCDRDADGSPVDAEQVQAAVHDLASRGMRVLALATAAGSSGGEDVEGVLGGTPLRLLGLVGMIDPLRPEAVAAVRACREAAIEVKMVTGDHPTTAVAIGRELGLVEEGDAVVTGQRIAAASDEELGELAATRRVFARVAPEHKLRLVTLLQARGEIVAMTGDGVNDAPALKRADIGVAMGIGGTAVAREAADMVLADDDFASIEAAVEEGRRVYDNLIKSLAFILPTSLGQAMIILVAVLFFPVRDGHLLMPIDPVQILWVNLVVAIALALPLAFEAPEPDLMRRPPRPPRAPLLSPFLVGRTFLVGSLMTAAAVALFLYEYRRDLRFGLDPAEALAESQTVTVTTIILFQAAYLLNCRSLTESVFRVGLFSNPYVYVGIAVTLALQLCLVYLPPLQRLFHTHPLGPEDWILPVLVALVGLPVITLEKRWRRHRQGVRG